MPYRINQFKRVYREGCAYFLPSRINIMATYILSAVSFLILVFNGVYRKGFAYLLPSRINIVATYIQSVVSFLILVLSCNAKKLKYYC